MQKQVKTLREDKIFFLIFGNLNSIAYTCTEILKILPLNIQTTSFINIHHFIFNFYV